MKKIFSILLFPFYSMLISAQEAKPDLKLEIIHLLGDDFKSRYPAYMEYDSPLGNYRLTTGDQANIQFKIKNNGQASSGKFRLTVKVINTGKEGIFEKTYTNLEPGETVYYSKNVVIPGVNGIIRCGAQIEMQEKEDWNTKDNYVPENDFITWKKENVDRYLRPDFEIKISSPNSTRPLTTTVKLLVEVTNRGNVVSPASMVRLICKEKDTKKKPVPPLKPGESFKHEFQHKWYTLGNKKCTCEVDFEHKILEVNDFKDGLTDNGVYTNKAEIDVYIK